MCFLMESSFLQYTQKRGIYYTWRRFIVIRANDKEASFRGLTLDSYYYRKGGTGLPGKPRMY